MSSSLRYTFTNLCSAPSSSTSLPARPGYCAVSVGEHLADRRALGAHRRRAVGVDAQQGGETNFDGHHASLQLRPRGQHSVTSSGDGSRLGARSDHGRLEHSAITPSRIRYARSIGLVVAQRHDHVDPRRVDGLAHVGRRRVRVGVGVGVPDPDDLVARVLGVAHRRGGSRDRRPCRCAPTRRRCGTGSTSVTAPVGSSVHAGPIIGPDEQPARFVGEAVVAVADDALRTAPRSAAASVDANVTCSCRCAAVDRLPHPLAR